MMKSQFLESEQLKAVERPIVMTDDNEIDTMIAYRVYKRANLTLPFVILNSGSALLNYMHDVQEGSKVMPKVVLLDINMPGLSGFDVLTEIRSTDAFKDVPDIIMLTNSDGRSDISRSEELGANGFQTKPHDLDTYESFFRSLVDS